MEVQSSATESFDWFSVFIPITDNYQAKSDIMDIWKHTRMEVTFP